MTSSPIEGEHAIRYDTTLRI